MGRFLVRIIIADIVILAIQAALLLCHPFLLQSNHLLPDLVIHLIFTIRNDAILFLNPPLLIFLYYVLFFLTHKMEGLTFRLSLLGILNFILLYCISWVEMLLLIASDVRI